MGSTTPYRKYRKNRHFHPTWGTLRGLFGRLLPISPACKRPWLTPLRRGKEDAPAAC